MTAQKYCSCPCHVKGAIGFFHCFGPCCEHFDQVVYASDADQEHARRIVRESTNESRDFFAEKKLEDDMDETFLALQNASTPTQRRKLFERLRMLKTQRSAEKIRELERERGL